MDVATKNTIKRYAKRYLDYGLNVIAINYSGDKKPLFKWKEFQERMVTPEEIDRWPACNIAVVTGTISNLVIIDCESRGDAEWFWRKRGRSPVIVQSRRGFHFWFRHPGGRVKNAQKVSEKYDVRGDGGYALAPPSIHREGCYRFVPGCELIDVAKLPTFNEEWLPVASTAIANGKAVSDGIKYIRCIRAVAGERGHGNTYRACCRLRDAGMSAEQALAAMIQWNETNAHPKWSVADLLHKIEDAFRN